jgi:hypothetical protein
MMVGMWTWMRKLRLSYWTVVVWAFAYFGYLCTHRLDLDYGWHYRSGQYILAHGVPRHDIFSYTASNFGWVNHEWLNDVFMFLVARHWGYDALGVIMAALWAASMVLSVKSRRLGWTAAGLALGALLLYVGVRPVTWTVLGLAVVLRVLDSRRPKYWLLVPAFALWANLHAGFALGLAMVALKAALDRSWKTAGWGLVMAAATLANPFGFGVYVELFRTMSDGMLASRIVEWGPLAMNYAVAPYLLTVIVLLVMEQGWGFGRVRAAGLVLATLWTNRQLPLMVVGTLDLLNHRLEQGLAAAELAWVRVALGLLVGVAFPLAVLQWPPRTNGGISLQQPVQALRQLKARPCQGHIFNDYNYGGFMIWALPAVPMYIDGRMPSWRGPQGSYLDRYVQVLKGGAVTDEEFARFNVQCAVLSRYDDRLIAHLKRLPGWRLALKAEGSELWRRD